MKTMELECASCGTSSIIAVDAATMDKVCPSCNTPWQIEVFPALVYPQKEGKQADFIVEEMESSCFYHPAKRAETVCENCGRFLCALCDVTFESHHLCPNCIEANTSGTKKKTNESVRYDKLTLTLAILPIITVWFTLFTAPITLFLVFRHWRTPLSIIPQNRWRFVIAALLAIGQIGIWGFILYTFIYSF